MNPIRIVSVVAAFLTLVALDAYAEPQRMITYDDFIRLVEQGQVKAVSLGIGIAGTMTAEGKEDCFRCNAVLFTPAADPLLNRLLKEKGVEVVATPSGWIETDMGGGWWGMLAIFAIWILPIVLNIFVLVLLFKALHRLKVLLAAQEKGSP